MVTSRATMKRFDAAVPTRGWDRFTSTSTPIQSRSTRSLRLIDHHGPPGESMAPTEAPRISLKTLYNALRDLRDTHLG